MSKLNEALSVWFAPPRPHGEAVANRRVSFVELFYDLLAGMTVVWLLAFQRAAAHGRLTNGVSLESK